MTTCAKMERNTIVLIALETTPGVEVTDLNNFSAAQILAGSTIDTGGPDDVMIEQLKQSFTAVKFTPGTAIYDLNFKVPMVGGGLVSTVLQPPAFDKLMQISSFVRKDALTVNVGTSLTGDWTVGTTVKKGATVIGELVEVQTIGSNQTLHLIGVTNPLIDADAITADSGGTATVSGTPTTAYSYVFTSKCNEMKTATIRWYADGILMVATGVRGDFTLDATVNKTPELTFKLQGLYNEPVDLAISNLKSPTDQPPLVINVGLKVGSFSPIDVTALQIAAGNSLKMNEDMNTVTGISGFHIDTRSVKGSFDPRVESMADYNPFNKWKTGELSMLSGQFGSVAGNAFRFVLPEIQYKRPKMSPKDGKLKYNQEFVPTGNDDREFILFAM
jgi:hypothetical protein